MCPNVFPGVSNGSLMEPGAVKGSWGRSTRQPGYAEYDHTVKIKVVQTQICLMNNETASHETSQHITGPNTIIM